MNEHRAIERPWLAFLFFALGPVIQSLNATPLLEVGEGWRSLVRLVGSVFAADRIVIWGAEMDKLSDYLVISEAAEYLGVSPNTLRNWVNAGKVAAIRHPVNDYRLFDRTDLDALLKEVATATRKAVKQVQTVRNSKGKLRQ